jgi:hypothetical protein
VSSRLLASNYISIPKTVLAKFRLRIGVVETAPGYLKPILPFSFLGGAHYYTEVSIMKAPKTGVSCA